MGRRIRREHVVTPSHKKGRKNAQKKNYFFTDGEPDRVLLGVVLVLVAFGLMMIASAGVLYANDRFDDPYHFFKRQLIGVGLGVTVLLILQKIDYHIFRRWSIHIYIGTILLLVAVLMPGIGVEAYGAKRWLLIGGMSFQPAEAVKLAMVLYMSAWCASKGAKRISNIWEGFIPFLFIMGGVSFLIILQPDVGTLGMITLIAVSIFFLAGASLRHIATMSGIGGVVLALLILPSDYRMGRVMTFLNPAADPQGAGYQIGQAFIAIGSGGLAGLGLGYSRQKAHYLPEPVGDSIFAIIGEELGFIGCVAVIALLGVVAWRIYLIAHNAPDLFGRLVATGVGVWLVGQALMNIAAITGLMPLTGIPLSFISYGGTSMVFALAAVGIVLNISRQAKK